MDKDRKTETNNEWVRSHNMKTNNESSCNSKTQKSDKENEWVSTNKN